MKEYNLNVPMHSYQWEELTDEQREVVTIAKEQTDRSYCPYSRYHVGAAAKLANGEIVRGCNQENAAYPSGLCAERSALFAAGAQYPDEPVTMLAIACYTGGHFTKEPGSPCGACRQVMAEYEHRQKQAIPLLLPGPDGSIYRFRSLSDLLPFGFSADDLPTAQQTPKA
jgi:cytidine deaminase